MKLYEFAVEFVFDYMVILTDVTPAYEADCHEEDIIKMAKDNILTEYGLDLYEKDYLINDIVIHDKNYGYYPPSQRPDWAVQ